MNKFKFMRARAGIPNRFDRIIVHQFDAKTHAPGGIDTCIRGLLKHAPKGMKIGVVGVDSSKLGAKRKLGEWESQKFGQETFWFMPVTRLDPANQRRLVPHSLRMILSILKRKRQIGTASIWQFHRMDVALFLGVFFRKPFTYFIHTQENGLTGANSDSFWRYLGNAHHKLEETVVRNAAANVVFNPEFISTVKRWNSNSLFSPTWYEPALDEVEPAAIDGNRVLWVGRLEVPKDPTLALKAFAALNALCPDQEWKLDILGDGSLKDFLKKSVDDLGEELRSKISILGRVSPEVVSARMYRSRLFLMTSHVGYEGYPRVLVEALASGLPAVVTNGSDTGGLVIEGVTGFSTNRDPGSLARKMMIASEFERTTVKNSVAHLTAEAVTKVIFNFVSGNGLEKS